MTNAADGSNPLRTVLAKIDADVPLKTPLHSNQAHISPRLDRLEAKLAYMADYIAFLEQRIQSLEGRVVS
ncbi:hypothetical protein [Microbacterium testaceum]|uniref:hypothetical protein n=1 Tax=Microbacterium testaceum TaxID=2033 RepID=UPI0025B09673|nr:hypothetical protein [Microbacterium testaceum]WJS92075.1 hypothetical protein NYQ11_05875 [Microbacterium testaceum]